ncbi:unnamed protein product [Ixodes pacificus]
MQEARNKGTSTRFGGNGDTQNRRVKARVRDRKWWCQLHVPFPPGRKLWHNVHAVEAKYAYQSVYYYEATHNIVSNVFAQKYKSGHLNTRHLFVHYPAFLKRAASKDT